MIHSALQANSRRQCTLRGAIIDCTANTESRGTILEIGGKALEVQLTLFIVRAALMAAFSTTTEPAAGTGADSSSTIDSDGTADNATVWPRVGEIVGYANRKYQISRVTMDSDETAYRLELQDINR